MPPDPGGSRTGSKALTLRIDRLGGDGDGIATWPDGEKLFIPFALPGELLSVSQESKRRGRIEAIIEPSAARVAPSCKHFGTCGGCALQHAGGELYADYKNGLLTEALSRAGYDVVPETLIRSQPGERRRLDLAAVRAGGRLLLGLHERGGTKVIDMRECPVTHPTLVALLPKLRATLSGLVGLRNAGDIVLNLLDSGPDLLLRTDMALDARDRTALAAFALAAGIPRIAWTRGIGEPEIVAQLGPVAQHFGNATVQPPPGAFLQASAASEIAIRDAVLAGLPDKLPVKSRIVELYAGIGSFTFALAERGRVLAVEGSAPACAALRRAAGGHRIEVVVRDLTRQPLRAPEFSGVAVVVLDPPHAGAAVQMAGIIASGVKRVIYVSCHPAALSRDLAMLRQGGYQLLRATPIDQFLWSANLESVLVLEKG